MVFVARWSVFTYGLSGVNLRLSDREKFCSIFRIFGRIFDPKF